MQRVGLTQRDDVLGKTARELYEIADKIPEIGGIGVDDHKQYIHIDVREGLIVAKWCYAPAGGQIPFYLV